MRVPARPRLARVAVSGFALALATTAAPAAGTRVPVIRTAAGSLGSGHPRAVSQYVASLAVSGSTVYAGDPVASVVRAFDTAGRRQWVAAGTGNDRVLGTGGLATRSSVGSATALAAFPGGGFVVAGMGYVQRVDRAGRIHVIAGGGTKTGTLIDGAKGRELQLGRVAGVAVGAGGTVYVGQSDTHQVLAVGPDGTVRVVAGTGVAGHAGLGGPARTLSLNVPTGLAVTTAGDLLVADTKNHRVLRVDPLGLSHPFAGLGPESGYAGDGGPAALARLTDPRGLAVTPAGDVLVAETAVIRRIARDGVISTLTRVEATVVAVAANGDVFFTSGSRVFVRRAAGGRTSHIAGLPTGALNGYDSATGGIPSRLQTRHPRGVAARGGVFYWTDFDTKAWRLGNGRAAIIADGTPEYVGDGTDQLLLSMRAVEALADGRLLVVDSSGSQIFARKGRGWLPFAGRKHVCVPWGDADIGDGGPAAEAELCLPGGLTSAGGTVYVADTYHQRIRAIDARGRIRTVAGTGTAGFAGDGGRATAATLSHPEDVAVGPDGSLYVADKANHVIRRIGKDGVIRTVAGTPGSAGYSGDGGPARAARLNYPASVAVAPDGTLYVADTDNAVIRRVDRRGVITTVAGNGRNEFSGDGGAARRAGIGCPNDLAYDATTARLYVADTCNTRVRVVQL